MLLQAIILAGGFGTRLQTVVPGLPKAMAPIGTKPFLACLLDYLQSQAFNSIIISIHYLGEKIQNYFGDCYRGMQITYVDEDQPLGTGGAIQQVLNKIVLTKPTFILNGDTFVKLNYQKMYAEHLKKPALITIGLQIVDDVSRYGRVIVKNGIAIQLDEKSNCGAGLINSGVYLVNANILQDYILPEKFSFEIDFLASKLSALQPRVFITDDYFIDIGVPEDYARAKQELSKSCIT